MPDTSESPRGLSVSEDFLRKALTAFGREMSLSQ